MKFKAIKIGSQLQIGFGVIVFLIVLLGVLSLRQTDKIAQQTIDLYQHPLQVRMALGQLNNNILSMRLEFSNFLHAIDEQAKEKSIKNIEAFHSNAEQQFAILNERYLGPKQDIVEALDAFEQWFMKMEVIKDQVYNVINKESLRQLQLTDDYNGKPELLLKLINKIDDFAEAKGNELFQNAINLDQVLRRQMVMFVLAIFAFSLFILFNLVRNIRRPLKQISDATRSFREGKIQTRCDYLQKNEFGALSSAFNDLADTIETELTLNKQSSKLAEIMLNENEAHGFCYQLLNALIEYTGSQLGAVYLLDGSNTTFEKFVGIGLDGEGIKTFSATHFEGEFGTALATKKIQYITSIAVSYTHLTLPTNREV